MELKGKIQPIGGKYMKICCFPIKYILIAFYINFIIFGKSTLSQELMSNNNSYFINDISDIYEMSLEDLMELDIQTGKPGWFGSQLEQIEFDPYIHGYAVTDYRDYDFNRGRFVDTFDLHYFNIIIGTNIGDKIGAETLLEYEHGGDDIAMRYGIIDYEIIKPMNLRMGKFLLPIGRFNAYLSPEYANKLPDRPKCLWNIVPIVWSEVGVQLWGQFELQSNRSLNYAFYTVNGLEQSANEDGSVADGGDIRDMRKNHRDSNNNDKAYGGRIGYKPFKEFEIGVSYYTGAYTIDGRQNLSITDIDAEYKADKITLRGEYVKAWQETSGIDLEKEGFYTEAAYRINRNFEPVVRYDQADLDDKSGHNMKRGTLGLVYYPNPKLYPMFNFKISQSLIFDDGTGDRQHEFVLQCVIGF